MDPIGTKLSVRASRRIVTAAVALLAVETASATEIFHPSPNSCGTNNCNAIVLGGTVNSVVGNRAGPWTVQLFADSRQCLRLSVSQSGPQLNLETVVVAPNGSVYRNAGGGSPLVKFVAPKAGYYAVSISESGGDDIERDFNLSYGLYNNAANNNCNNPTNPQ